MLNDMATTSITGGASLCAVRVNALVSTLENETMKVKAKWEFHNGKKFELKEVETFWCCEDAEQSNAITFGDVDNILNIDERVNISSCAPYPEGAVWNEEAINFCPFCGAKIEIDIEC